MSIPVHKIKVCSEFIQGGNKQGAKDTVHTMGEYAEIEKKSGYQELQQLLTLTS